MLKTNRFVIMLSLLLCGCFLPFGRAVFAGDFDTLLSGAKNMGEFLASGAGAKYYDDKVTVLSAVSGQPMYVWKAPWGDNEEGANIENNSTNRCRLIKTLKPGETLVMQTRHNTEALLSRYATDLYVEAIKTEFDIDRENAIAPVKHAAEHTLIKREVLARLANIATRLNVIVSLEARTAAMDNIAKLSKVGSYVFNEYVYNPEDGTCAIPHATKSKKGE